MIDADWYQGRLGGREGIVPAAYVTAIEAPQGGGEAEEDASGAGVGATAGGGGEGGGDEGAGASGAGGAAGAGDSIFVKVEQLTGKGGTVKALRGDTIASFKEKLYDQFGVPPESSAVLLPNGEELANDATLEGSGIENYDTLHHVIKPVKPINPPVQEEEVVTAKFDFAGDQEGDLPFRKGDRIAVVTKGAGAEAWWTGRAVHGGAEGSFPGNYVV